MTELSRPQPQSKFNHKSRALAQVSARVIDPFKIATI